jgi:hypothetical protein
MNFSDESHDPSRDVPRRKDYDYKTNKLFIEATNPHGFFRIKMERGVTPQELDGLWTDFYMAEQRVLNYITNATKGKEAA